MVPATRTEENNVNMFTKPIAEKYSAPLTIPLTTSTNRIVKGALKPKSRNSSSVLLHVKNMFTGDFIILPI
jgi:hypothetical protein